VPPVGLETDTGRILRTVNLTYPGGRGPYAVRHSGNRSEVDHLQRHDGAAHYATRKPYRRELAARTPSRCHPATRRDDAAMNAPKTGLATAYQF